MTLIIVAIVVNIPLPAADFGSRRGIAFGGLLADDKRIFGGFAKFWSVLA